MQCTNCGASVPDGKENCPGCGAPINQFRLEDLDLIHRFKVGDKASWGFNILARFIDNVFKSFNTHLIAPYIKYRMRALQTVMLVVVISILTTAVLAYYEVISGEVFVFMAGIFLGFILASFGRMFGPV